MYQLLRFLVAIGKDAEHLPQRGTRLLHAQRPVEREAAEEMPDLLARLEHRVFQLLHLAMGANRVADFGKELAARTAPLPEETDERFVVQPRQWTARNRAIGQAGEERLRLAPRPHPAIGHKLVSHRPVERLRNGEIEVRQHLVDDLAKTPCPIAAAGLELLDDQRAGPFDLHVTAEGLRRDPDGIGRRRRRSDVDPRRPLGGAQDLKGNAFDVPFSGRHTCGGLYTIAGAAAVRAHTQRSRPVRAVAKKCAFSARVPVVAPHRS